MSELGSLGLWIGGLAAIAAHQTARRLRRRYRPGRLYLVVQDLFLESRGEHREVSQGDLLVCECSGPHHGYFSRVGDPEDFVGVLHTEYVDRIREL